MKIAMILKDLGVGGTQRVAENYALALKQLGEDVRVFAYKAAGVRQAILEAHGIDVIVASGDNLSIDKGLSTLCKWQPDIVHFHREGGPNASETRILRSLKATGAKTVETNVFAQFDRTLAPGDFDLHFQLTRWAASKYQKRAGKRAAQEKSVIVPNAVRADTFVPRSPAQRAADREALGIGECTFVFGRIGQPIESKWHVAAIDSFEELSRDRLDVALLLVGAPTNVVKRVNALPNYVRERIILRPVTTKDSEVASYYGAMDGFLHVARIGESFGMVLCEAMMMGLPIVTLATPTRDNSQVEIVGHKNRGIVCLKSSALADAMRSLIRSVERGEFLNKESRRWVIENFDATIVSKKLTCYYMKLKENADIRNEVIDPLEIKKIRKSGFGKYNLIDDIIFSMIDSDIHSRIFSLARGVRKLAWTTGH